MAVANSMHDVAAVLRHLAQMVRDGRIVVVRLKCRFLVRHYSTGISLNRWSWWLVVPRRLTPTPINVSSLMLRCAALSMTS